MAGIIFAASSGQLNLEQVAKMLKGEIKEWPAYVDMASPQGLYLSKVEFHPEDLMNSTDDYTEIPLIPRKDPDAYWIKELNGKDQKCIQ